MLEPEQVAQAYARWIADGEQLHVFTVEGDRLTEPCARGCRCRDRTDEILSQRWGITARPSDTPGPGFIRNPCPEPAYLS